MNQRHKWADVIIAWANGEPIQVEQESGKWKDYGVSPISPMFSPALNYRIKPRTIKIGDMEVPEPLREFPVFGEKYYLPYITGDVLFCDIVWQNMPVQNNAYKRGLIHLTPEAAISHAKALIAVSGGKV